jgi:DNA-binding CsgD family transcriptional regulator
MTTRKPLSERQLEILKMVAYGQPDKEIGAHLGISARTVAGHMNKVLDKLGARTRAHAVWLCFACKKGS